MKPLIGLTCRNEYLDNTKSNKINYTYIDATRKAGAIPIILPVVNDLDSIEKFMNTVEGIILTGGEDASPLLYGEEPIREVDTICYERDYMEIEIIKKAYEMSIPILGICRGIQMINVA